MNHKTTASVRWTYVEKYLQQNLDNLDVFYFNDNIKKFHDKYFGSESHFGNTINDRKEYNNSLQRFMKWLKRDDYQKILNYIKLHKGSIPESIRTKQASFKNHKQKSVKSLKNKDSKIVSINSDADNISKNLNKALTYLKRVPVTTSIQFARKFIELHEVK